MMVVNVVETSSVEALAFNYFRFGLFVVVNNLWTLVAVVTAAVSFWRFRLVPSLTRRLFRVSVVVDSAESPTVISRPAVDETMIPPEASSAAVIFRGVDRDGGVVKGNRVYSRFYYDDVIVDEEEEEDDEGLVAMHEDETVCFVSEKLRLLDLGFYEYQDLRVLDGNVVRLWDSCRASRSATESCPKGRQMW
ncbi:unnamed protein product [Rhodiola kirilowii]